MTAPRLEIDLGKISANAAMLVARLGARGIAATGITKGVLGHPDIADALLNAGICGIGDSHIENIERMRAALGSGPRLTMIRSPMLSQAERVVRSADISFNTEAVVIERLSQAATAQGRTHGIVLMVELGDLREWIMPDDLLDAARMTIALPNLVLMGIGTNLACLNGVSPDATKMAELSSLAQAVEWAFSIKLAIVSGGNSANIDWAFGSDDTGRINDVRLGEAILLGREALHRKPIDGLHSDAFTLVAEVIEVKVKPSQPWGAIAQNAFGEVVETVERGPVSQAVLAIGRQDCDAAGLYPPPGMAILGTSSDHLILEAGDTLPKVGEEICFGIDYTTLLRAMTSPFVEKVSSDPIALVAEADSGLQVAGSSR